MSNMSYCRFENTSKDLGDCLDAIENGKFKDLNSYEQTGILEILHLCEHILEWEDEIKDAIYSEKE
jgi:hypothetical protein